MMLQFLQESKVRESIRIPVMGQFFSLQCPEMLQEIEDMDAFQLASFWMEEIVKKVVVKDLGPDGNYVWFLHPMGPVYTDILGTEHCRVLRPEEMDETECEELQPLEKDEESLSSPENTTPPCESPTITGRDEKLLITEKPISCVLFIIQEGQIFDIKHYGRVYVAFRNLFLANRSQQWCAATLMKELLYLEYEADYSHFLMYQVNVKWTIDNAKRVDDVFQNIWTKCPYFYHHWL